MHACIIYSMYTGIVICSIEISINNDREGHVFGTMRIQLISTELVPLIIHKHKHELNIKEDEENVKEQQCRVLIDEM